MYGSVALLIEPNEIPIPSEVERNMTCVMSSPALKFKTML